jgi:hypothetical protein
MQASQRAMQILKVAPNLGRHPDIVAALAYNTAIPFTPETINLIGAITKARSAINYAKEFTMDDFNKTAHIVNPEAFATNGFWDRLGKGIGKEVGYAGEVLNVANKPFTMGPGWVQFLTQHFGPFAPYYDTMDALKIGGKVLSPVGKKIEETNRSRKVELPEGITAKKSDTGRVEFYNNGKLMSDNEAAQLQEYTLGPGSVAAIAGIPGSVIVKPSKIGKAVTQFIADQFDTPEHLYRYVASVQHKYGFGYAALALAPMALGAVAGTALGGLGGAEGAELSGAAEEALVNLVAQEGLPDLAATTLSGQALSDAMRIAETETARIAAAQSAARTTEKIATPFVKGLMAVPRGISKVATSPTALGADIGFTGGGQGLFRQEYMDSRDGTVWAKKNPELASTLGRWATEWMPEGGIKSGLSGAIDAAAFVAFPDALGAIGRMKGIARSAEGFQGGILSAKYSPEETAARIQARSDAYQAKYDEAVANGTLPEFLAKQLGIKGKIRRSPAWFGNVYDRQVGARADKFYTTIGGKYRTGTALSNIDRAYNESPSVRTTVNLIAQLGSADAVIAVDPRFAAYSDLLAEARVLNADGTVNMTDSVENVKRVFRDSQTAEALLDTTRQMPISHMPYSGGKIKRKVGVTIKTIDKNGLTKELPLYTDLPELKIENRKFTAGDRNSLPAVSSWLTFAFGRGVAEQVVNELAKTTNPQVWENVIVHAINEANYKIFAEEMAGIKLPQFVIDEIATKLKPLTNTRLREILNFGGPGARGHYGIGINGVTARTLTGEQAFGEYYRPEDLSMVQSHVAKMENPSYWQDAITKAAKAGNRRKVTQLERGRAREIQEGLLDDLEKDIVEKGYPEFSKLAQGSAEEMATELSKFLAHQEAVAANKAAAMERNEAWTGWDQIEQKLKDQGSTFRVRGTESLPAEVTPLINKFAKAVGEDLFNDVRLTYSQKVGSSLGSFSFANAVMKLYPKAIEESGADFVRTAFHELFHILSRFTPENFVSEIEKSLVKGREKYIKENPELKGVLSSSPKASWDETIGNRKLREIIAKAHPELDEDGVNNLLRKHFTGLTDEDGTVVAYKWNIGRDVMANYRLTNVDEHFAERMADMARSRFKLPGEGSIWQSIQEAFRKLLGAVQAVIGKKGMRRLFENFNKGKYSGSEMTREYGLMGNSSVEAPAMNPSAGGSLTGANHPLTTVEDEAGNSMAAGIVPSDVGKMILPSYQQQKRINEGLAKIFQEIYKDVLDTGPKIAKLEEKLFQLNEAMNKAVDPADVTRLKNEMDEATARLDIQRKIGALPLDPKKFDQSWLEKTAASYGPQAIHDTINHYYNDLWFKNLALATGGWAIRTGISEAMLNIFRQGPLNYTAARLAASTARQERAVLHIGKKFTREAAQDIAARIYHVVKENEMLRNGQVFESDLEMQAAVANVRRVANETFTNLTLNKKEIMQAIADEERNMRGFTMDNAVARYRGTLIGLKRAAVKGLGKDELLDAAIKLMYLNNGHIVSPMLNATHAGVAHDMQAGSITGEEIDAATYQRPLVGRNRVLQEGHYSRIYHSVEGAEARYPGDLFYRAQRMANDSTYQQTTEAYAKMYKQAKARLTAQGGLSEKEISIEAANEAAMGIFNEVKDLLDNLPADVRSAMIRTQRPLAKDNPLRARNNPSYYKNGDRNDEFLLTPEQEASVDHATAVIKSAEGTFRFRDGAINENLMNAISDQKLPEDLGRFKKLFMTDADGKEIPRGNFNSVPGPELDHAKFSVVERALNATAGRLASSIHRKALGPIVNRLTRDPIFIIDFAAERRVLEPMVKDGQLTRDQADALAQTRASVNVMKFIHNPKNKLKFENMMRAWAPFYFAENQAWRRLGRLALTNPGAAEQYTKAMYAAQDVIYQASQNNNNMSIPIPGSTSLNKYVFGPVVSSLSTLRTFKFEPTLGSDQGIEFNPSSARTLFPWVTEGGGKPGIGSLVSSFIPAFGPFVSIPVGMYVQNAAGTIPFADEFLAKHVVGDAGMAQSIALSFIAPNAILANAIRIAAGTTTTGNADSTTKINNDALSKITSSFVAAENMAIVSVLDNEQRNAIEEAKRETAQALKSYKPGSWTADKDKESFQYFMDLGGTPAGWTSLLTIKKMMDIIDPQPENKGKYQEFRDKVNAMAVSLNAEKLVAAGVSPFSIQVGRANPKLHQEWQDLLAKEGSVITALPKWYKKYPWATAETLFTTQATNAELTGTKSASGVSYPTTEGMGKYMIDNKKDFTNYSSAMRWVLPTEFEPKPKATGNDQLAHMLQVSWGLRAQKAPAGLIRTYQDSIFNQFVYGVLQPWGDRLVKKAGWTVTDVNDFLLHNKQKWRNGAKPQKDYSLLEQFGNTYAPLAFKDYISAQGAVNRNDAMTELIKATNDPAMVKKYPRFGLIKEVLLPQSQILEKTLSSSIPSGATWGDTDIPYRDGLAAWWQGRMDQTEAEYPELKPVVTQLFRPLAPVFTN